MTPQEAYDAGWDYPPGIGHFGVLSPRTCGCCGIDKTLYWKVITNQEAIAAGEYKFTPEELALIERVQNEPESMLIGDTG